MRQHVSYQTAFECLDLLEPAQTQGGGDEVHLKFLVGVAVTRGLTQAQVSRPVMPIRLVLSQTVKI